MSQIGSEKVPKYYVIERDLRAQIEEGKIAVGQQVDTEHSLSAKYGVSRLTARKAIGNLETKGYLTRTPGRGTFVTDWRKKGPSPGLVHKGISAIFIDAETDNLWNFRLLQSLSLEAEAKGYPINLCGTTSRQLSDGMLPLAIRDDRTNGAIINGVLSDLQIRHLEKHSIPYLLVGNYERTYGLANVCFDAEDAICQVTSHLLELGRGPVWLVVEPFSLFYTRQMYQGYQRAVFKYRQAANLLNAALPVQCDEIADRMAASGRERFCIVTMPSHVNGLLTGLKASGIDLNNVTMVVFGQREPWWHHDEQIMLCEIPAEIFGREAVRQMIDGIENHAAMKGRIFHLNIDRQNNGRTPLTFGWV